MIGTYLPDTSEPGGTPIIHFTDETQGKMKMAPREVFSERIIWRRGSYSFHFLGSSWTKLGRRWRRGDICVLRSIFVAMTTAATLSGVFQALMLYMGFLIPQDTLPK